ncbi:MAG: hypothetical protein GEU71_13050 [Actinobacteria bacterium]|nr:hypothetical protein [Actinomycetota bacterium]
MGFRKGRRLETRALRRHPIQLLLAGHLQNLDQLIGRVEEALSSSLESGASLTTVLDSDYPANLRVIFDLPPFLTYRGDLRSSDAWSVAVVGTRDASAEGLAKASRMAGLLAGREVTVLSGLARGIDTAAHTAALDANGRTMGLPLLSPWTRPSYMLVACSTSSLWRQAATT